MKFIFTKAESMIAMFLLVLHLPANRMYEYKQPGCNKYLRCSAYYSKQ